MDVSQHIIVNKVISFLPKDKKELLQRALSHRVSNRSIEIFAGTINQSDLFKIFKHSLISIFPKRNEDKEFQLLLHLVRVCLDTVISDEISIRKDKTDGKASKVTKEKVQICQVDPKQKKKAKKALKHNALDELPDIVSPPINETPTHQPMVVQEIVQENTIAPNTLGDIMEETVTATEIANTEIPSRKRVRKRAAKRIVGSATPDTPEMKRYALDELLDQDSRCDVTEISADEVYSVVWRYGCPIAHDCLQYAKLPPSHIGLACKAKRLKDCRDCLYTLLSYPLTPCKTAKCVDTSHMGGLFIHNVVEFSKQEFHDEKHDANLLEKLMLERKLTPSLMMIYTRDKSDRSRKLRIKSKVDELIDNIMADSNI